VDEIKFRARRLSGEWVYGFYNRIKRFPNLFNDKESYLHTIQIDTSMEYAAENRYIFEVDSETVTQFIGVRDFHEREIYVGDIILDSFADWHVTYEVVYNATLAAFMLHRDGDYYEFDSLASSARVIGNIFENPELKQFKEREE
jgi:hypothetical protein